MSKMNHIKVNLPEDEDAYQSGNGEGVWVIVDDETKKLHDDDKENIIAKGILDNALGIIKGYMQA